MYCSDGPARFTAARPRAGGHRLHKRARNLLEWVDGGVLGSSAKSVLGSMGGYAY